MSDMAERLRLKALDQDDLQVIAACLQDALIPLREMVFMAEDQRFMAAFSRFQRERCTDQDEALTLCQSALRVDHVDAVKYRGLDRDLDGVKFELLTIFAEPISGDGFHIVLLFAGDVAIRLQVSKLALSIDDFGDPWPAIVAPRHDLAPPSAEDG
ncbi:MAG: DUF2948 family protein [Geminicoccaceae bacterium]